MKRKKKLKTNVAAVQPCSVMLTKLDIEHNKQYTEKENAKTNGTEGQDQDQDVSVEEQPKKENLETDLQYRKRDSEYYAQWCPKRKCTRHYGIKQALHCHMLNNHSGNKRFYCIDKNDNRTDCLQSFPLKQLLDQHTKGVHGEGFIAYCGEAYTWSWQ